MDEETKKKLNENPIVSSEVFGGPEELINAILSSIMEQNAIPKEVMIGYPDDMELPEGAHEFAKKFSELLGIPVQFVPVSDDEYREIKDISEPKGLWD